MDSKTNTFTRGSKRSVHSSAKPLRVSENKNEDNSPLLTLALSGQIFMKYTSVKRLNEQKNFRRIGGYNE